MTIAIDAISYLIDAALNASIRVDEPRPDSRTRNLRAEIRAGLQWTYRHRTLGPLAASTHIWFLANGAAMTVLSLLALRSLGFTAYTFGMLLTVFGITSLVGAPPPSMRLKPAPGVSKHLAVSSVRPPTTSRPDIESCPASNELAASAIDSAAYGS